MEVQEAELALTLASPVCFFVCLFFFQQEGEEGEGVVDVVAGVATDVSASKGGAKDEEKQEEEEEEQEEAFVKDLERERAGTTFSKAKEEEEEGESDSDSDGEDDDSSSSSDAEEGEGEAEGLEEVAPVVKEKQTEDQEHHELSRVKWASYFVFQNQETKISGKFGVRRKCSPTFWRKAPRMPKSLLSEKDW